MKKKKEDPYLNEVGIFSLEDLTKKELLFVLKAVIQSSSSAKFWHGRYMIEVARKRHEKKLEEDEKKGERWISLQKEYEDLMRPYFGWKLGDIPMEITEKAAKLQGDIEKAQKEYFATFE